MTIFVMICTYIENALSNKHKISKRKKNSLFDFGSGKYVDWISSSLLAHKPHCKTFSQLE